MTGLPPIEIHLVQELREKAMKALQEKGEDNFHPADIKRIKEDDHSVWAFLVHQRREVSWAFDMLMECLKWRKEFGVNDIKDSEFPQFFDDIGAMYVLNKDKQGHRLIIMHVRRYRKEPIIANLARRYFVYNLEKLVREDDRHRVTILFDLHGAGLNNVDMDFLFFMFSCFKTYYPSSVAHILVFDMPWIFTAMWKVVKGWLNSRAVSKIKFVNKNSVLEYIDPDQLLEEFGGNGKTIITDEDFKVNIKIAEKALGVKL